MNEITSLSIKTHTKLLSTTVVYVDETNYNNDLGSLLYLKLARCNSNIQSSLTSQLKILIGETIRLTKKEPLTHKFIVRGRAKTLTSLIKDLFSRVTSSI